MRSYDLMVIGAGSGNMLFGPELDGVRSAIIEPDRYRGHHRARLRRNALPISW